MMKISNFRRNFNTAILNALNVDVVDFKSLRFELYPTFENYSDERSTDSWMIHVELNYALRRTNVVSYNEAIRLMSAGKQRYPLWARVKKVNDQRLSVEFSPRYVFIKECHNQVTGFPPFAFNSSRIENE